jgi:uncharacterized protein (TIGR02270 family)
LRRDIAEEHLDEAGFLHGQWELALRSPMYVLSEIAEGPEGRLLAHLDGLVVVGSAIADDLLVPALVGDEPGLVFAAAFALLETARPADLAVVLGALEKAESPESRAAIRRALAVAPRAGLPGHLKGLAAKAGPIQADLLEVLAALRVDPAIPLEPVWNTRVAQNELAALRLARVFPARLNPMGVQRALGSTVPEVRAAALEAGLVQGERATLNACEATLGAAGPGFARAALLLGLSGDERSVAPLVAALRDARLAAEAAFALGFSGRVSAGDALVRVLDEEAIAPIAAEALGAIAGMVVAKQLAKPPERFDPGVVEADVVESAGAVSDLPKPDAEMVTEWWWRAKPKLDASQRLLRGQRWTPEGLLHELEEGPARRREGLALELAIRSKGQSAVSWDALAEKQRRQMQEARAALSRVSIKSFRD